MFPSHALLTSRFAHHTPTHTLALSLSLALTRAGSIDATSYERYSARGLPIVFLAVPLPPAAEGDDAAATAASAAAAAAHQARVT